ARSVQRSILLLSSAHRWATVDAGLDRRSERTPPVGKTVRPPYARPHFFPSFRRPRSDIYFRKLKRLRLSPPGALFSPASVTALLLLPLSTTLGGERIVRGANCDLNSKPAGHEVVFNGVAR